MGLVFGVPRERYVSDCAGPAFRERTRHQLNDPYRALRCHFRREFGCYDWDQRVAGTLNGPPPRKATSCNRTL